MRCRLAQRDDEAHLRRILAGHAMPGAIRTAYEREPDFHRALEVMGTFQQTLVAEEDGELLGLGIRALRPVLVNGRPMQLGYLGGLRTLARARGGPALARGFRLLRELHGDGRTPAYLSTILEANLPVRALLTSARAPLPHYLDLGRFSTYALLAGRRSPVRPAGGLRVEPGSAALLPEILAFLQARQGSLQFAPDLSSGLEPAGFYRDFSPGDFRLARRDGRLVGVIGVWDQSAFRQTRITGYAPWLGLLRPGLNLLATALGVPGLPAPGRTLGEAYLAFRGIEGDDPAVLVALVQAVLAERPGRILLVALHERDPLRPALRAFRRIPYHARLYCVCWEDGLPFYNGLDPRRVPTLELARL